MMVASRRLCAMKERQPERSSSEYGVLKSSHAKMRRLVFFSS